MPSASQLACGLSHSRCHRLRPLLELYRDKVPHFCFGTIFHFAFVFSWKKRGKIFSPPIRHRRLTKKPSLILDHWGKKVPTSTFQPTIPIQSIIFHLLANFIRDFWGVCNTFLQFAGPPPGRPGSCRGGGDCGLWRDCSQVLSSGWVQCCLVPRRVGRGT